LLLAGGRAAQNVEGGQGEEGGDEPSAGGAPGDEVATICARWLLAVDGIQCLVRRHGLSSFAVREEQTTWLWFS
jgi:hypothetical protein